LVSSLAVVYRFIKKKFSKGESLIILGLVSTGLLYLFFNRVHVYLIIFVCIFIGYSGWLIKRKLPKLYALWLIFIGFCLCFETAKITANVDSLGRGVEYKVLNQTIDWVKNNTAEDDVLLSHFNVSPPFLTYADRAIALHPKFESPGMRAKVKEYAFALFSEKREEFYDFCIKKKVNYFIYPMGTFSERSHLGWRYITATPADARGTSAYKLEKFNSGLDNFVLVYRNWKYKIYKVYGPEELSKAKDYYTAGNDYLNKNRYEAAALEYKKALEVYPGYFQARVKLGTACYKLGDEDTAKSLWKQAHRLKEERLK
ncbi:MAG: hypothetical protein KAV18_02150, partial [Candidatus Omnitrophica bacterium]|nr:hypothetical protein [Candidatus Omnitrophota bacterium]